MTTITTIDKTAAHKYSFRNREFIEKSKLCGCFYCVTVFAPEAIKEWTDEGQTALCPHCDIDSVLSDFMGTPISEPFLQAMHYRWFPNL